MNEAINRIVFHPETIADERRIYRATPVGLSDSSVMLLNQYGTALLTIEYGLTLLNIPDADEVILGENGGFYACWFGTENFQVQEYSYRNKKFIPMGKLNSLSISGLQPNSLVVLGVPGGIELWLDDGEQCRKLATVIHDTVLGSSIIVQTRPRGELIFSSGQVLGFIEDLGVRGTFLNLLDLQTEKVQRVRSAYAFSALNRVFAIASSDPSDSEKLHGLYVFAGGETSFIETDGPVMEAGGDLYRVVMSVFTGNDAELRIIDSEDMVAVSLDSPAGYKAISPDGGLYAVRGFSNELIVESVSCHSKGVSRKRKKQVAELTVVGESSLVPNRKYLISRAPSETKATIIHFHGGPESYEVPEGRLFGLPQWCNASGIDWIGVNYRGSIMPEQQWTRSAWYKWRSVLQEDLAGALDLASGSIVLAGWSFGAAIALALGSFSQRIRGLLLGGVPGALIEHVGYAISLDLEHRSWFSLRFDLTGDDGKFFSGIEGFSQHLRVLEIHGKEDPHCPVILADKVAKLWEESGNPWERIWIPGQGHYASTWEDVEIVATVSRKFLNRVLRDER